MSKAGAILARRVLLQCVGRSGYGRRLFKKKSDRKQLINVRSEVSLVRRAFSWERYENSERARGIVVGKPADDKSARRSSRSRKKTIRFRNFQINLSIFALSGSREASPNNKSRFGFRLSKLELVFLIVFGWCWVCDPARS